MHAGPLIETRALVRTYRTGDMEFTALRDISISIAQGEMLAIMGASGSGKSTLMNILGLLDRPTSGTYLLDGEDTADFSTSQLAELRGHRIGFVFQQFHLLARTRAVDNVELPLHYRADVPRHAWRARARAALAHVGLSDKEANHPSQLSGGQQQRVAIARALVGEPQIILADEPTGNLDSRTGLEILMLLRALNADGRTIVLITHEANVARCARRIIKLHDGRMRSDERVATPMDPAQLLAALPPPMESAGAQSSPQSSGATP